MPHSVDPSSINPLSSGFNNLRPTHHAPAIHPSIHPPLHPAPSVLNRRFSSSARAPARSSSAAASARIALTSSAFLGADALVSPSRSASLLASPSLIPAA